METRQLTEMIIGAAFRVHKALGFGFLEKVYENALCLELAELGLKARQQAPIEVWYRGQIVGEYYCDLLVENCVIIEIKAVARLAVEHEVQLVNYLTATGIDDGLLLNFGRTVEVRHKYRVYKERGASQNAQEGQVTVLHPVHPDDYSDAPHETG